MKIVTAQSEFHSKKQRVTKQSVGLVPTMGALHDGHAALIHTAKKHADIVVVSIFVNPTQFRPNEDFTAYPRTFEHDCELCKALGVDIVYAPNTNDVYKKNNTTSLTTQGAALGLENMFRPDFFNGVIQIVSKLFNTIQPNSAYFGEKDYQQLCVIKQLVRDMDYPIDIIAVPTHREPDGLAMSSRNRYLNDEERKIASQLNQSLHSCLQEIEKTKNISKSLAKTHEKLRKIGFRKVDYIALRDSETLNPVETCSGTQNARLLVAAWLGTTRLIDNIACTI